MKVVMISNGLSHHQVPLCDWLSAHVDFMYIATKPISEERLGMGYADLNETKPYVFCSYKNKANHNNALKLVNQADFVICGSAPLGMVIRRILQRKYIFWASERVFKKNKISWKIYLFFFIAITLASKSKTFLLAASAYASRDFNHFCLPQQQMIKWGYFPPIIQPEKSEKHPFSLLWVGRFLDWKHPELALHTMKVLKAKGKHFHLTMIGDGNMAEGLKEYCRENDLTECVSFSGFLPNHEIHKAMAQSQILLATSDFQEGWGAVINEAMGHGCAVVASHAMGATPFLIEDGVNGFIFENGNLDELTSKVEKLLDNQGLLDKISHNALDTIQKNWNGEVAGERLLTIMRQLEQGKQPEYPQRGVCSIAPLLDNQWYGNGK